MKTVLKLVIAIALLNAVVRGADAAWNYYQLRDAVQRTLLFGTALASTQIRSQIMSAAAELQLPLKPEDLTVRTTANRRVATGRYVKPVEFFPNYPYPLEFTFDIESLATGNLPPDDYVPPPQQ